MEKRKAKPAEPARGRRRPAAAAPATRPPLTRERIARAALELIDREGLDGCSMRRLGASLGVEAMALYHHFPSKGVLLDAVMDLLLDPVEDVLGRRGAPLERIADAMRAWRGIALAHPHAFVLLTGRRFNTERAFDVYEKMLAAFAELGLDAGSSARWFRTAGYYAGGAGMADIASRERQPDATPLLLEHGAALAHPHIAAVAPHLRVEKLDAVFEFGLSVILDGLRAACAGAATPRARRSASA